MRTTLSTVRGFNASVLSWLLLWGLAAFGYFGLMGVAFNLYLLRLGFGPEFIGLLLGTGQLVWGIAALPAAALGRRVGLRPVLFCAYGLMGGGVGLLLLVEGLPRLVWEPWLFATWAVVWVGASFVTVNSVPYAMLLVDGQDRNVLFPVQQAVIAVTTFAGSLVAGVLPGILVALMGGSLTDAAPYRAVLWIVPLMFLAGIPLLTRTHPLRPAATRVVDAIADRRRPMATFLILGAIVVLQTAAEGPVRAFFNVYLDRGLGVHPAQIGLVIGAAQLLPVVGALATVSLLARWGAARTLSMASFGTTMSLLLLVGIPLTMAAGLGYMGVMTMSSMQAPTRQVFSQESVVARWRGTTSAILTIGTAVGWATTAAAGGYAISSAGFGGLFALSAAFSVGATALAWVAYRMQDRLAPAAVASASA